MALNRYGTIYGDTARQNEINNITQTATQAANAVGTVVSCAMVGSAAGPVGAVIGAAVGIVLEAVQTVMTVSENLRNYDNKMKEEEKNSNMAKERLGILALSEGR